MIVLVVEDNTTIAELLSLAMDREPVDPTLSFADANSLDEATKACAIETGEAMEPLVERYEVRAVTTDFEQLMHPEPWADVDVAVIDLMLGVSYMSGLDILQYLKNYHPHVRRVCFSAAAEYMDGLLELADAVVTKTSSSLIEIRAAIRGE